LDWFSQNRLELT